MADVVLTARAGAVLTITLNRPEVYNAINRAMHDGLAAALEQAADPAVRAVVLTGAGRGFCSGQDLREFQELPGGVREALEQTYHPNVRAIRALEKPVIAAINGPCAGAGLSLACACDVRIASSEASFVPGFIGIGLVPDAGSTWFIHRILGFSTGLRVDGLQPAAERTPRRWSGDSSPRTCLPSGSRSASPSSPTGTPSDRRARSR